MYRIAFLISFMTFSVTAQSVTVSGIAPSYVNQDIEIYEIEDYFSMKERLVASTKVNADSTFSVVISSSYIQKIVIHAADNSGFLYVQPNSRYNLYIPEKNKYDPYRQNGNNIEIGFRELDSTDINYKILGFQRWIDDFIGNNYYLATRDPVIYVERLDKFKTNVEKAYTSDTSYFFKTFVRFSIAGLDNVNHGAERNRYEKHDFYLKNTPVQYHNDAYMEYIADFYQQMIPRLSNKANEQVYIGVLKSSPTVVMKGLASEYTLVGLRMREMIMLKSLSEMYETKRFPQTNILTILDSVSNHSLYKTNEIIAKNLRDRLTQLVPGVIAPDFVLSESGKETKTLGAYRDKYVYLHFIDPNRKENIKELDLLKSVHSDYKDYVQFVTLYRQADSLDTNNLNLIKELDWDVYELTRGNSIWKNYRIESYPNYILIDATGNIVASPALGPTPDGQYQTIDKTFFYIKKRVDLANEPEKGIYDGIDGR